ncbi:MAG: hypothetical protein KTV68_09660 [Acidimicrobiia bacterium]|nr:hypothetical protein [Acidimicrobiia bacterium]MCY4434559.1 hypothetical protein [bacterium]
MRMLLLWLKQYDRLMVAWRERRLAPKDPLYTRIKDPGQLIHNISGALSAIVKEWIGELGIDLLKYSTTASTKQ